MDRRVVVALCVFVSLRAFAQTAPQPTPPAPVFPITGYVDRYLDSSTTRDFQAPVRTYRAGTVKVAPELDRIFMIFGGSFVAYNISTFEQRLAAPMATGPNGELYAPFDMSVDPQRQGSGWSTVLVDGQDRLFDFDWDDRGYIYLAYSVWGWGIVDLQGALQSQRVAPPVPLRITTVKANGRYYALVQDDPSTNITAVFDTTDPRAPVFARNLPFSFVEGAKSQSEIAVLTASGELRIYSPEALVTGGAFETIPPITGGRARHLTSDGSSFFVSYFNSTTGFMTVTEIRNIGAVHQQTMIYSRFGVINSSMHYGAGYIGMFGRGTAFTVDILRRSGTGWEGYDLSSYFRSSYAAPIGRFNPISAAPVATPVGIRLITAFFGVGDVWGLHSPGTFQFSSPSAEVNESDGSVSLTVQRTGGSDGAVTIPFTILPGTASPGLDYSSSLTSISFATGETSRTLIVTILNDTLVESDETLTVTLGTPSDGSIGAQPSVVVTIVDDEDPAGIPALSDLALLFLAGAIGLIACLRLRA